MGMYACWNTSSTISSSAAPAPPCLSTLLVLPMLPTPMATPSPASAPTSLAPSPPSPRPRRVPRSMALQLSASRHASMLSAVTSGSVTNSNISRTVGTATPFLLKNWPRCSRSSRRKSRQRGWSRSTLWLTSMMCAWPAWYRMLYSLKSACTRRQSWYMRRTSTSSWLNSEQYLDSDSTASFSRGAARPASPTKVITSTCERSSRTSGTRMPASFRRIRLRISFSAHVCTILRGFLRL
mmetsp:Transcript_36933/g.91256  ORF Transcript_36933/g.91256 Transcript_36933/m.91256 type:complete len:238 (-) Transcript_36933:444-1157(-)